MIDKLCLIPYSEIIADKTYTNISEYFLRNNPSVSSFLLSFGMEDQCSDYELLSRFMMAVSDNSSQDAAVVRTFEKIVSRLTNRTEILLSSPETIWEKCSEALFKEENKLRSSIALSGLESIGVPLAKNERCDPHFADCGNVKVSAVYCPFGTKNISYDTIDDLNLTADRGGDVRSCAAFMDGFNFEKPNEYHARQALEKYLIGKNLNTDEKAILSSQLLRNLALTAEREELEFMMFLPQAPDVKSMGAAAVFLDYLDESVIKTSLNITVFSRDAVGSCMAASLLGKKYKKLTLTAGLGGNGCELPDTDSAKYWGMGNISIAARASLCPTAAMLNILG